MSYNLGKVYFYYIFFIYLLTFLLTKNTFVNKLQNVTKKQTNIKKLQEPAENQKIVFGSVIR